MHAMVVAQCPQPLVGIGQQGLTPEEYYGFVAGGCFEKTNTDLFKKQIT